MFTQGYKRYVLVMLAVAYMLSLLDRGLIMLLLQPIKDDLHLSDTQLGFLTGIAFTLFYGALGIPLARWADRGNRVTITALAVGLGCIATIGCLFVTNFIQLTFTRIVSGIGDAGTKPAAYSLVGDYYPHPAERARAMAIYFTGNAGASLLSFMLGGWLNKLYGWRMTFFLVALPGLLIAILIKLTVVEPRSRTSRADVPRHPLPPLITVLATIWEQRSLRYIAIALTLVYTMGGGLGPWYAAFMIRSHGMHTAELGTWLGTIFSLGGVAGLALGSYLTTHWFAGNERGQMRMSAVTVAALVPCFAAFLLLPNKYHALLALIPLMVALYCFIGPTYALVQRLVPDEMRATTLAVLMLLATLVGHSVGSQLVGILSDGLAPTLGINSLRYAMLSMSLLALWSAVSFWRAGDTVRTDLNALGTASIPSDAILPRA